jgi:hypothetical protein
MCNRYLHERVGEIMSDTGKATIARAALKAFEPMIDLCLDIGINSPELESLVRAVFVHRVRDRLAQQNSDPRAASDVRVALTSGVHRNFVRQILAQAPQIAPDRTEKRHRTSRLLRAWHTEHRYLDNAWHPRELPLHAPDKEPSFADLVQRYMPGVTVGVALEELSRAAAVQVLPAEHVRVKSRSYRTAGVTLASVNDAAEKAKDLLRTMFFNMRKPAVPRICEDMSVISVERGRAAAAMHVVNKRVKTFIEALEQELAVTSTGKGRGDEVELGLTVYSWER